jgi:hypothetical protein
MTKYNNAQVVSSRFSILVSGLMDKLVELLECCSSYYTPQEHIHEKKYVVFHCCFPVQSRERYVAFNLAHGH